MIGTVPARCLSCGQIVTAEVTRKGPAMLAHKHEGAALPRWMKDASARSSGDGSSHEDLGDASREFR